MKKIAIAALSTLALMTFFSNAFAEMYVSTTPNSNVISDPAKPFVGKVYSVEYSNYNGSGQLIKIDLGDKSNNHVQITFSGADFAAGVAFSNTVGKLLVVKFADRYFKVDTVSVYDVVPVFVINNKINSLY